MADLQSWRRQAQLARPTDNTNISHSQIDDVVPSEGASYSTSPGADESKLRPRPRRSLASFASYLGTHHRTGSPSSRPEWPSIDWSNLNSLNDKDGVYKPDTELMCVTVMQHVLANPSADLPAQYNTFLLHLIEAYHQSKADVRELQMKLTEATKCNQITVDEFHGAISSRSLKRAHMLQDLEKADSKTLHSTGPVKEAIAARLRKHSPKVQTPKSKLEYKSCGQKQKQVDKTRTSERHQLVSSAHRQRKSSTAAMGIELSHDHWPPSPLPQGMELIDRDTSSAESEGEGHRVLMSASDAFSGLEHHIASRLASWLALRLKCQPNDVISELTEPFRLTRKEFQGGLAPSTIGTLPPDIPTAFGKVIPSGKDKIPQGRSNKLIEMNGSLSLQSMRTLSHHRGFSFLPEDDSGNQISSNAFGGQDMDSETNFIHPLAWQDTKQREHNESGESAKHGSLGGMAVGSSLQQRLTKSVVSSTAGSGVSRNPQRHGSGKKVLNTIITSSSRSSSLSQQTPLNSNAERDSLREGYIGPGDAHFAVAAARAAKNGTITARTFYRQSSS